MLDRFRRYGTTLNDELAKINCYELSVPNVNYYDQYIEGLRKAIHENPANWEQFVSSVSGR